jgi:hypothetical protein
MFTKLEQDLFINNKITMKQYKVLKDIKEWEIIDNIDNLFEEIEKIDFSEFIWRSWEDLIIKWNRGLYSWGETKNITYGEKVIYFNDEINYEVIKLEELKYWDVFIIRDMFEEKHLKASDFNIYLWKNTYYHVFQCINIDNWIECITKWLCLTNELVYKFLRK